PGERQYEINRAIQILSRSYKNNPVVITEAQTVRDVIVAGIAARIAAGKTPPALQGKRLFELNLPALFHDSKDGAALIDQLSGVLDEVSRAPFKVILLIDPLPALIGPFAAFDGASSALLRDALRKRTLQLIGASTDIAYQQGISGDETLAPLYTTGRVKE